MVFCYLFFSVADYVGKLWLAGGFLWSCPSVRVFVGYMYWIHLDFFRLEVDGGLMVVVLVDAGFLVRRFGGVVL